jgi:hypothetical protein
MQLTAIPPNEQESALGSFWTMLQECESKADDNNDPVLKHWVEQWYLQWNRITLSNKAPRWAGQAKP